MSPSAIISITKRSIDSLKPEVKPYFLTRIFHKDRREELERVVDTRHAWKNTRRHTVSMLRMFFKRNEVDAMLSSFAVGRL